MFQILSFNLKKSRSVFKKSFFLDFNKYQSPNIYDVTCYIFYIVSTQPTNSIWISSLKKCMKISCSSSRYWNEQLGAVLLGAKINSCQVVLWSIKNSRHYFSHPLVIHFSLPFLHKIKCEILESLAVHWLHNWCTLNKCVIHFTPKPYGTCTFLQSVDHCYAILSLRMYHINYFHIVKNNNSFYSHRLCRIAVTWYCEYSCIITTRVMIHDTVGMSIIIITTDQLKPGQSSTSSWSSLTFFWKVPQRFYM